MVLVRTACGRQGVFELFVFSLSRPSLSLSLVFVFKKEAFSPVVARRLPSFLSRAFEPLSLLDFFIIFTRP